MIHISRYILPSIDCQFVSKGAQQKQIDISSGLQLQDLLMRSKTLKRKNRKKLFPEILKIDVFRATFRFSYIFFVFACYPATGHNFLHMNLNFGMRGPQDICNDCLFQFSNFFIFSLFGPFFSFFFIYSLYLSQITLLDLQT